MPLHPAVLPAVVAVAVVVAVLPRVHLDVRSGWRWLRWLHRYGCLAVAVFAAAILGSWVGWAWLTLEALVLPERPAESAPVASTVVARIVDALDSLSLVGAFATLAVALREVLRAVV